MSSLSGLIQATSGYKQLKKDFESGRFNHAYLVSGQDAPFLKHFLRYAAALAVCSNGGCLECSSCRKALKDSHADILVYPREKEVLRKDEINEIVSNCFILPIESRIKVYSLNVFDKTDPAMQNKLLKTLEEPPENTVFFLGVSNESTVLDTIKSRCSRISLDRAEFNSVVSYLVDKGAAQSEAQIAAIVSFSQPFTAENYAAGKTFFSMFDDVLDTVKNLSSSREAINAVSRLAEYRERQAELANMLLAIFKETLAFSANPDSLLLTCKKNDIIAITGKFSTAALTAAIDYINNARTKLEQRCNFNAVLDWLVLSILEVKHRCPK